MPKPNYGPRVYCTVHGSQLADDCVECQGEQVEVPAEPAPEPEPED